MVSFYIEIDIHVELSLNQDCFGYREAESKVDVIIIQFIGQFQYFL
jgi:hypothetical protein